MAQIDQFTRMQSQASFAGSDADMSMVSTNSLMEALAKLPAPKVEANIDCRVPKQMALMLDVAGTKKGKELDFWSTMLLAIHAGMFVSFGAGFFTVIHSAAPADQVYFGAQKFAGGIGFCTGLAMVILCGSELFTGNTMTLVMAWAACKITILDVLRNWTIVWIGNFLGSLIIAAIQIWGRKFALASGQVGLNALAFAEAKCGREWGQCYCLGILCNIMVCWAIWMTLAARESASKLLVFILPITAFAAMGFEHSIANMYFLPFGLMIKTYADQNFWDLIGKKRDDYTNVAVGTCIGMNIIPATIGNASGAIIFCALPYWYLYLRDADHKSKFEFSIGSMKFFASPPVKPAPKEKKKKADKP